MTTGEIIFAVMVSIQGLLFLIGMGLIVAFLTKEKGDRFQSIAYILWAISPVFSMVGIFFGVFL